MTITANQVSQSTPLLAKIANGRTIALDAIPTFTVDDFNRMVLTNVAMGQRVAAFFGASIPNSSVTQLYIVLADDEETRAFCWQSRN